MRLNVRNGLLNQLPDLSSLLVVPSEARPSYPLSSDWNASRADELRSAGLIAGGLGTLAGSQG